MEFIKITPQDQQQIEAVYSVLKASGTYMVETFGLMHWANPYSREKIAQDIEQKDVYIVRNDDGYLATFMLSEDTSYYFQDIPDKDAVYLSKLAVNPDVVSSGIGTACMKFIEETCRQNHKTKVRLDVYDKSVQAVNFYLKMGYKELFLKDTTNFRVICMEKEL